MMKVLIFAAALLVCAGQVSAQEAHLYDLYYGLPGAKGALGVDVGVASSDLNSIGDATDLPIMAKYGVSDQLEVGARITSGVLSDTRDSFSSILAGGKYKLGESNAVSANALLPIGDAKDLGLSVGYMMDMEAAGLMWHNHLQVGLLDGYAADGINLDLLLEPTKELNDKLIGYLDILIATNTDQIGDNLGINLGPNVDYLLSDSMAINAGVTLGITGEAKADDIGLSVTLLTYVR